jgi:diguanylate cyclase (GGDEF)-like protein
MSRSRFYENAAINVVLAAVYFAAAKFGLRLAFVNASVTAVWPSTGIALAALLLLGYRVWPGIFIGAFLANLTTAGSFATSIGIAAGNTLEGVAGCYLVERFAGGRAAFDRVQNVLRFAILAGMGSTMLSATIGVTSLSLGGFADWKQYSDIWLTWWTGDATGDLVVAPLVILWGSNFNLRWGAEKALEAAALVAFLYIAEQAVFERLLLPGFNHYPLEFLIFPLFIWVAFRFGPREAATVNFLVAGVAVWGTLHRLGPFVRQSPSESLLLLQTYTGVTGVMTMAMAALVSERQRAEYQLSLLARTDPVTGIANYRRLMEVLNSEVLRSKRTGQPKALLMLDLDGLKRINDRHGHLTGTKALCRVAFALCETCRAIDTAARYGGDEFAMILVDTGKADAELVARRIMERVAGDGGEPPLTVSVGVAVYPEDGETSEALLAAADRRLYAMKTEGGGKVGLPA